MVPWPTEFVWLEPVPPASEWGRPGLVMFFSLECAGCVARGVPFLKELHLEHGESLVLFMVHTALGRRAYPREEVVSQLERFASDFARLPVPVALDLDGALAEAWGAEGTPHWFAFDRRGTLVRSIFGSQENARTRLRYLLEELVAAGPDGRPER